MIYVTGDCHSSFEKFSTKNFPVQKEMTKDDYVIICGDFGGVWNYQTESKDEKYWLDWLNDKNFTVLFVDGNHENFDRLYSYPTEEWHGGKIHKIRDSVYHLMRGEIYDICGKKLFAFGGASSHDISDGILEMNDENKICHYRKCGMRYRIRNFSWWDLELPTEDEMKNGIVNLEKVDYKVDYVITHCAPTTIQTLLGGANFEPDYLTDFFQDIFAKLKFSKWVFGHYHENKYIYIDFICLYEKIIRLE